MEKNYNALLFELIKEKRIRIIRRRSVGHRTSESKENMYLRDLYGFLHKDGTYTQDIVDGTHE